VFCARAGPHLVHPADHQQRVGPRHSRPGRPGRVERQPAGAGRLLPAVSRLGSPCSWSRARQRS